MGGGWGGGEGGGEGVNPLPDIVLRRRSFKITAGGRRLEKPGKRFKDKKSQPVVRHHGGKNHARGLHAGDNVSRVGVGSFSHKNTAYREV